jgi:hypothetical protein
MISGFSGCEGELTQLLLYSIDVTWKDFNKKIYCNS